MDKFQVYNRLQNAWEDENVELIPGWDENFVQDKTTDNGKVKLKYKGNTAPNWHNGDWCRILHLEGNDVGATYIARTEAITRDVDYVVKDNVTYEYDAETSDITFNVGVQLESGMSITFGFYAYVDGEDNPVYMSIFEPCDETTESFTYNLAEEYADRKGKTFVSLIEQRIAIISTFVVTKQETKTINYYEPLNHEQYIVTNPTMVYDKVNDEWDVQILLKEPIEYAKGIICETRSFTNQIGKVIDEVEYNHEPKNHLNVLESILRCTPANNDINKSWYSRVKICDANWLRRQPFNDDTFSEGTMCDILLTKYDSSLGRTPVLYFDINGETDRPYNTNRDEYSLKFIRQDGFDKPEIQLSDLIRDNSSIIASENWDNKADGVVSNIDNLAPSSSVTYVSEYLWAIPEIDSDERNISGYGSDSNKGIWVLKTPHTIKSVKSLKRIEILNRRVGDDFLLSRETEDLTDYVLEKKQYISSEDYDTRDVIWYEEGKNLIHLNDFYYDAERGYFYRIEYEPLISMRYDNGKDYQTIINQVDGQVGEDRYSKYLEDYINSMNKADLTISKTVENWSDIEKLGSRVIDGDKTYLITNIGVSNRGFDYDVVYQLNENHMRKNDSIIAPQNIRKNIAIGYDGLTDRKSCFITNCKLSLNSFEEEKSHKNFYNKKTMYSALLQEDNLKAPLLAKINFYSVYDYANGQGKILHQAPRLCNGAKTIIDNTFCFNLKYEDNAICGKRKTLSKYGTGSYAAYTSPTAQAPILYTDGFGEVASFDVSLINIYNEELQDVPGTRDIDEYNKTNAYLSATTNYPLIDGIDETTTEYISTIKDIQYDKDMLDIFNYTIAYKVNSDMNIILCKNFFLNSALFGGSTKIKYATANSTNIQENDAVYSNGIEITSTLVDNLLTITLDEPITNYKSITLWDENEMPVMIINDANKLTQNQFDGQILKLYC